MTNGDRIRTMSDEELAQLLDTGGIEFFSCDDCIYRDKEACERNSCYDEILAYLRMTSGETNITEKKKYVVTGIYHSGRKGIRGIPVEDPKYDGIVGSTIKSYDVEKLRKFQDFRFDFVGTVIPHGTWVTSPVIGMIRTSGLNAIASEYHIETINAIYVIKEVS